MKSEQSPRREGIKKKVNEFKGYSLFDDIENATIRTWNRCQTYINIKEAHGPELAEDYLKQFNKAGQSHLYVMFKAITVKGYDKVRHDVQKVINEST